MATLGLGILFALTIYGLGLALGMWLAGGFWLVVGGRLRKANQRPSKKEHLLGIGVLLLGTIMLGSVTRNTIHGMYGATVAPVGFMLCLLFLGTTLPWLRACRYPSTHA